MSGIFLSLAIQVNLMLKDGYQKYFKRQQNGKKTGAVFDIMRCQQTAPTKSYINKGKRPN